MNTKSNSFFKRGIIVDCDLNGDTIGFHWTNAEKNNPYLNLDGLAHQINENATKLVNDPRVWLPIEDKPKIIEIVQSLAKQVFEAAHRSY